MADNKFDISNAISVGGGVVNTVFGFFGQDLTNKGKEIEGKYATELAKIKADTSGNQQAYAVALAKLDAEYKAKADALNAEGTKQTIVVIAVLVAFLGILTATVLVLRRPKK